MGGVEKDHSQCQEDRGILHTLDKDIYHSARKQSVSSGTSLDLPNLALPGVVRRQLHSCKSVRIGFSIMGSPLG